MIHGSQIPSVRLDAQLVGERHCYDAWREEVRPIYDVEPFSGAANGQEQVQAWLLDDLIFSEVGFSHQSFSHNARHASNANYLSLQVYRRGAMRGTIADTPLEVMPGEVHIFDFSREFHSVAEASAVAGAVVSHEAVGYDPGQHPAHMKFSSSSAIGRFLAETFFALMGQLPGLQKADAKAVSEGFCGLIRGLLTAASPEATPNRRFQAERRAEMRSYLERHLADAELSAERLCKEFGASRASIYRDFAEAGGVARYITQRRLDRIFHQLLSTSPARGRIQEVASRWGFDDPGHFSRLFRQRFGVPPSVVLGSGDTAAKPSRWQTLSANHLDRDASLGRWLKAM